MDKKDIMRLEDLYTADTYNRYEVAIAEGQGARCRDPEGKEYIDFTSGIGVNCLGFSDPGWVDAIRAQAGAVQHTSNLFYNEACAIAARMLSERTGMPKVFFCNSGAEANEGAIKAARKYSHMRYGDELCDDNDIFERFEIVTLRGSFHGRTLATITASGQDAFHRGFPPFSQGFIYAEANDIESFKACISDRVCAVMAELVQGEGGVNNLDEGYVREIAKICKENDILFIVDEVQTGIGRTGKFMAYEYFGVKPDIVTVAKGLGGGIPVGAILFGQGCSDALRPGEHGSTFGGNPMACAGAAYVLGRINEGFLAEVQDKGDYMRERIVSMPGIAGVSGLGLMIGAALKEKRPIDVVGACAKKGLLLLTAKDKLRFLPPLMIPRPDIDEGLAILEEALTE